MFKGKIDCVRSNVHHLKTPFTIVSVIAPIMPSANRTSCATLHDFFRSCHLPLGGSLRSGSFLKACAASNAQRASARQAANPNAADDAIATITSIASVLPEAVSVGEFLPGESRVEHADAAHRHGGDQLSCLHMRLACASMKLGNLFPVGRSLGGLTVLTSPRGYADSCMCC